jgi:KDO2-lipid IV(A) lauroyltransferase
MELVRASGFLPPDFPARDTARSVFANHGRGAWELVRLYHQGLASFQADCHRIEGEEYFAQALAESQRSGRGLVIITGHLGNWEIMFQYLAGLFDLKLTIVGRRTGRLIDTLTDRLRAMNGHRFLAKDGSARDMLAVLKSGGVLTTFIDQAILKKSPNAKIMTPFMGHEATFNLGPLRLARKAGAIIILVLFRREGRGHFGRAFPPLPPAPDRPEEEDHLAKADQINAWLGEFVRCHPDQWLWGHSRWKTTKAKSS